MINDTTAIAFNYSYIHKANLDHETPRVVVFVDIGHSKTTVMIAKLTSHKTQVLGHMSDRNMGGRDLDFKIAQFLAEDFKAKNGGLDPM